MERTPKPQVLASGRWRKLGDGDEVGRKLAAPASVPGWPGLSPHCPGTEGSVAAPAPVMLSQLPRLAACRTGEQRHWAAIGCPSEHATLLGN